MQNVKKKQQKRPQNKADKQQKRTPHGKSFKKPQKSMNEFNDQQIDQLKDGYAAIEADKIKKFSDFPLSQKTLKALNDAKYTTPTEVQRFSIGHALQGKDVLGAAVTGSGKTLAFLIPVIEHLYVNKWSRSDGICAIIISPTRELAYQIFETLKKIGKNHDFSAGLIIGGKNLKFERTRMDQCNILICTPGRLLQHMDENPIFNATTMEMLVLDEADRCLDMGFEQTLNSIIENFPPDRQTLLFSATQTNTVKDLARLNLRNAAYVGYRNKINENSTKVEGAELAVPDLLQQSYVVLPLGEKITMLWSFIKNHQKQKIIVFLSTCKQVKYIYEIFCKLRPGISLLALYGTLHQDRRIAIYEDFVRKSNVVLFATDVASRGLDFPAVNWVVQLDCPEDVSQYIHRAGRSARNKARGESLLVLLPSEEKHMIKALSEQKINLRHIQIDPKKLFSPRVKIEAYLAQFPELKASAQRAFFAYTKSVFLQRNKQIFTLLKLDLDEYARSLGLAVTPHSKHLDKILWLSKAKTMQNTKAITTTIQKSTHTDDIKKSNDEEDDDSEASASESEIVPQMMQRQLPKTVFKPPNSDSESDDDDFITIKRRDHDVAGNIEIADLDPDADATEPPLIVPKREKKLITKASLAKKAIKKNIIVNNKVTFDDEGDQIIDTRKQMQALANDEDEEALAEDNDNGGGINILRSKKLMDEEDKYDKQRFRELVKKRHKLAREKLKKKKHAEETTNDNSEGEDDDDDNDGHDDANDEYASDDNDDDSIDLSWLPDPNVIYKDKLAKDNKDLVEKNTSNISDDNDDEDDDDEADMPPMKKSKLTAKLTLDDTEAIAANLLGFMNS